MVLAMLLFWGGAAVLLIWAVRAFTTHRPLPPAPASPRQILDERLARGECRCALARGRPQQGIVPGANQSSRGAVGHGACTKNTYAQIDASGEVVPDVSILSARCAEVSPAFLYLDDGPVGATLGLSSSGRRAGHGAARGRRGGARGPRKGACCEVAGGRRAGSGRVGRRYRSGS